MSMSEHETSLNPFHIFAAESDDEAEELRSPTVIVRDDDTRLDSKRFQSTAKRYGGNSYRKVDHTHSILLEEEEVLNPVREEMHEASVDATVLEENIVTTSECEDDAHELDGRFKLQVQRDERGLTLKSAMSAASAAPSSDRRKKKPDENDENDDPYNLPWVD